MSIPLSLAKREAIGTPCGKINKGLFVAHGRVTAGIDLNQLKPTDVQVTPDGSHVSITLPAAQILDSYLDNIEVYDIQTGALAWYKPTRKYLTKRKWPAKPSADIRLPLGHSTNCQW